MLVQFTSSMSMTKYSIAIQISQHFIHPFTLVPMGFLLFQVLGWLLVPFTLAPQPRALLDSHTLVATSSPCCSHK
jgi:hypothetical protein